MNELFIQRSVPGFMTSYKLSLLKNSNNVFRFHYGSNVIAYDKHVNVDFAMVCPKTAHLNLRAQGIM